MNLNGNQEEGSDDENAQPEPSLARREEEEGTISMDVCVGSQSKKELRALYNNVIYDHEDRLRQRILFADALWCRNHDVSALVTLANLD